MKRFLYILFVAIIVSGFTSCANVNYGDISVDGYKLKSFSRVNDRSYRIGAILNLNNRGPKLYFEKVSGKVYHKGEALGTAFFEPITILKGSSDVDVDGKVEIDPGVSLVRLVVIARSFDLNDFTLDIDAVCKSGMLKKEFHKRNVPLMNILNKK